MKRLLQSVALALLPVTVLAAETRFGDGLPAGEVVLRADGHGDVHVAVLGTPGDIRVIRDGATVYRASPERLVGFDVASDGDAFGFEKIALLRLRDAWDEPRAVAGLSSGVGGRVFVSRRDDVWVAGAPMMLRSRSGETLRTGFNPGDAIRLEPRCEDSYGNLWAARVDRAGRGAGLAVLPIGEKLTPGDMGRWQTVELPREFGARWTDMCADDAGFVWAALETELARVDPQATDGGVRLFKAPAGAQISAIARAASRNLLVGFADGAIREIEVVTRTGEPVWRELRKGGGGPVRAMLHAADGSLWFVAGAELFQSDVAAEPWQRHWRERPRMPLGNHDNIFARMGDTLYTAGGKTFNGWPADKWVNLDHIWKYDIPSETWSVGPPMLESGKSYPGIAALEGELWIVGGLFRAGNGTKATATVEIHNPKSGDFRLGPKFPSERGQIVALSAGGRLYAVGGEDGPASDEMFSIGPGETAWRAEPAAPGPVTQAAGCVIGHRMFIAAGVRSNCPGLFVFDVKARTWSSVKHPADTPPAAPLVTALDDEVWVMGGRGKASGEVGVHAWSAKTEGWRRGPDLPLPLSWGAAAAVSGRLLIAGGAYREGRVGGFYNSDRVFVLKER